jgi:UDP-glucose 4-epimerase
MRQPGLTSLVTGGAGFIGSHLVEALLGLGRRVLVLDDLSTGRREGIAHLLHHRHLRFVHGSAMNEECLRPLLEQADEIYHLAAVVGVRLVMEEPQRTVTTNLRPVELLLDYLAEHPKPLLLASTSEVYGKNPKMPLSEDDDLILGPTTRSRWAYAGSKALDEYLALAQYQRTGLPVVIGRFFNVVGPGQIGSYGMVLPRFIDQALAGGPLEVHGDGSQVRCFAHVADVVPAILALMANPRARGKVFNIGTDEAVSIRELAERVVARLGPGLAIKYLPYHDVYPPGFEDIVRRIPDLGRIRSTIGYEPRYDLDDILDDVIRWRIPNGHARNLAAALT